METHHDRPLPPRPPSFLLVLPRRQAFDRTWILPQWPATSILVGFALFGTAILYLLSQIDVPSLHLSQSKMQPGLEQQHYPDPPGVASEAKESDSNKSKPQSSLRDLCLDFTVGETPDPFIVAAHGRFYLTFTGNNHIPMWEADTLAAFQNDQGTEVRKDPVWKPTPLTSASSRLWAPELHALNGTWYMYFAAADPRIGNRSHRMYVLRGPPSSASPHQTQPVLQADGSLKPAWELIGPVEGLDPQQWAIDGSIFTLLDENTGQENTYLVYSGWPVPPTSTPKVPGSTPGEPGFPDPDNPPYDLVQNIYITQLINPWTVSTSPSILLSAPFDHPWERTGLHTINEAPQFLTSPSSSPHPPWRGLVFSASGCWTPQYSLATLTLSPHSSPLDPHAWTKSQQPLLHSPLPANVSVSGPHGPGHASFLHIANHTFALFHATDRADSGVNGRRARLMPVRWVPGGPLMGNAGLLPSNGCVSDARIWIDNVTSGEEDTELRRELGRLFALIPGVRE